MHKQAFLSCNWKFYLPLNFLIALNRNRFAENKISVNTI